MAQETDIGGIKFTVEAEDRGIDKATESMEKLSKQADKTDKSIGKSSIAMDKYGNSLTDADKQMGRFIDKTGRMREKNGQFVKGLSEASSQAGKSTNSITSLNFGVMGFAKAAAAAAAAAAGLVGVVASQVKETDSMAKTLGVSTEALQQFQAAAKTVGIESEKMGDIFKDLEDKIGEAFQEGTGEGAAALELLGLKAQDLINLPVDEKLEVIGKALGDIESRSGQISIMEMLADDGSRLLPLLDDNNKKLQEMKQFALDYGIALSDIDNQALVQVAESMSEITMRAKGAANLFSAELAPVILVAQENIISMMDAFTADNIEAFVQYGVDAIGVLMDLVGSLEMHLRRMTIAWTYVASAATEAMAESADAVATLINTVLWPLQQVLGTVAQAWGVIAGAMSKITMGSVSDGFSAAAEALDSFGAKAKDFRVTADDIRDANDSVNESLYSQIAALKDMENSPAYSEQFKARLKSIRKEVEQKAEAEKEKRKQEKLSADQQKKTTKQIEAEEKAQKKANAERKKTAESIKDLVDPLRIVERKWEKAKELHANGLIDDETLEQYRKILNDMGTTAGEGGEEAGEEFSDSFIDAADLGGALAESIMSGDFSSVGRSLGGSLSKYIESSITDSLSGSLGKEMAGFAGSLGGGLAVGFAAKVFDELNDYYDPTADRQAAVGTGTVLGDISAKSESIASAADLIADSNDELVTINSGMLRALEQVQLGIEGASSLVARGASRADIQGISAPNLLGSANIQQAAGAFAGMQLLGPVGALLGDVIGSALGGKSKDVDEGVRILGGNLNDLVNSTLVEAYKEVSVKKHALDDYDNKLITEDLGSQVGNQFALVFKSIKDSVEAGADVLGESVDSYVKIATEMISLEDLNPEEQQKAIQDYFSAVFDDVAEAYIPYLDDFQKAGEGLGETLSRVSTNAEVVRDSADRLNLTFQDLSGRGLVETTSQVVQFAGGLESLISKQNDYYENFYSEQEQMADLQENLTDRFAELNLEMPKTDEGFRNLVEAQNLNTESGRKAYIGLLNVAGAFDDLTDYSSKAAEAVEASAKASAEMMLTASQNALTSAVSDYSKSLSDSIAKISEAAQAERDLLKARADSAKETISYLESVQSAAQSGLSTLSGGGSFAASSGSLDSVIAALRSGREVDPSMISGAVSGFTSLEDADFASSEEMAFQQAVIANKLSEIDKITGEQISVEEKTLAALNRQISDSEIAEQRQIDAMQAQFDELESQTNVLLGIDDSVKTVSQAIEALKLAMQSQEAANALSQGSGPGSQAVTDEDIQWTINEAVSRLGETEEAWNYLYNRAKDFGVSISRIEQFIPGATEWVERSGLPMFSSGGYTGDAGVGDVAGVVHGQEYVLNAKATSKIGTTALDAMNSGRNPAEIYGRNDTLDQSLIIQQLRANNEMMSAAYTQLIADQREILGIFDDVNDGANINVRVNA